MSIKEKLKEYLKYKGISVNAFERSIDASNGYLRNTTNISAEVLARICAVYSDVSAEWLLRGSGSMLLTNQIFENVRSGTINAYNNSGDNVQIHPTHYEELLQIVKKYQEQISEFQKQVTSLIAKIQ